MVAYLRIALYMCVYVFVLSTAISVSKSARVAACPGRIRPIKHAFSYFILQMVMATTDDGQQLVGTVGTVGSTVGVFCHYHWKPFLGLQTIFKAWYSVYSDHWQRYMNLRLAGLQKLRLYVDAVCREDNARKERRLAAEEHAEYDESNSQAESDEEHE